MAWIYLVFFLVIPLPSTERKIEHAGETYGFCSDGCLGKFKTNPEEYLSPRDSGPPASGS